MKVLNLQCGSRHAFEGWFGSEDDYLDQLQRGLVSCPSCGDSAIVKMPSAPRLNLSVGRSAPGPAAKNEVAPASVDLASTEMGRLKAAWWQAAREAVRNSEDVGSRFADEARRIHQGEAEERGIRGQATSEEVRSLLEEGVPILPLPDALKETLQ